MILVLPFFILFLIFMGGVGVIWRVRIAELWRRLPTLLPSRRRAEKDRIEYRTHLMQLPTHIAELERECGLDVGTYTLDHDKVDDFEYDYSYLPKGDVKLNLANPNYHSSLIAQPGSGGRKFICEHCGKDYQGIPESGLCSKCGPVYDAQDYESARIQTQNQANYAHAYDVLNEPEVKTRPCSRCEKEYPESAFEKAGGDWCANCAPFVMGHCQTCGAKFDGAMHCAIANGPEQPVICASCEIQRQKSVTVANSITEQQAAQSQQMVQQYGLPTQMGAWAHASLTGTGLTKAEKAASVPITMRRATPFRRAPVRRARK